MKKQSVPLKVTLRLSLTLVALAGGLVAVSSAARASTAATTTTTPTTTATAAGLITDGPSRSECLAPKVVGNGIEALQTAVAKFDALTDTSVSCISTYLNGAETWSAWETPWVTKPQYGYTAWVAEAPESRELLMQVDLIPNSLKDENDPLNWETSCANGAFTAHATRLGNSLVAAGLQHSVIRLGAEMNGAWESDFIGTTAVEQRLWVRCFQLEVIGLRRAPGEHFLIDWNPNPCPSHFSYATFYPGNSFVDIVGLDLFDVACSAPDTRYSFARLANEPAGLTSIEAFAHSHRKPMSLPEWGLTTFPSGDDPAFIDGIGLTFDTKDFAFETYFDGAGVRISVLPLGSRTPLSLAAFQRWFGSGTKKESTSPYQSAVASGRTF